MFQNLRTMIKSEFEACFPVPKPSSDGSGLCLRAFLEVVAKERKPVIATSHIY